MAPIQLGGSNGGGIKFSFWGMVAATMVALKLKEHYDDNCELLRVLRISV